MRSLPGLALASAAALCLAISACSGGSTSGTTVHTTTPPVQPSSGPAAAAAVKAMWQRFFNGTVPIPDRLKLLQNGSQFASFVHAQEKTSIGALVLAATAAVSSVTVQPSGQAGVIFNVLLNGRPLENNLHGTAVYVGSHWEVAASSFCSLLRLAYGKKSHVIPAACGS